MQGAGGLLNADIGNAAAIAYSKLNLAASILGTDIAAGAISNTQVNAAAAIAVSKIAGGLAGQVLQGTGPTYAYPPGFEIGYDQITASVTIASTTEGSPTAVIAGTSHTYENVPYMFHFYTYEFVAPSGTAQAKALLMMDGASVGRIMLAGSPIASAQNAFAMPGHFRYTPTAGAHTFGISAFADSLTGTPSIQAGAGGSGVIVPAFLRITKC